MKSRPQRSKSQHDELLVALREGQERLKAALEASKTGTFSFYHVGRTHGGTSTLPKLTLTELPEDGRRRKA